MKARSDLLVASLLVASSLVASACVPDSTAPPTSTTSTTTTTIPDPLTGNQSVAVVAGVPVDARQVTMTPDGRYVSFVSRVNDIVPGFGTVATIYRLDRATGSYVAVSVSPTGTPSNDGGPVTPENGGISDDGRYVVFASRATNLVLTPSAASKYQVYLRDIAAGTTVRVSEAPGVAPNDESRTPRLSHNGAYVSFRSESTNLGPADASSSYDVYRWSRQTGAIVRVSVGFDAGGNVVESDGPSLGAAPLDDGRVVYETKATNAVNGQTLPVPAAYRLVVTDPATRVGASLATGIFEDVTPDGRYLAYSTSEVRVAPDTNGHDDVVVQDTTTGVEELALRLATGDAPRSTYAALSSDGRYVMSRSGPGIVPGDPSTLGGFYLRDRQTGTVHRVSRLPDGSPGPGVTNLWDPNVSDNGRLVAFDVPETSYLPGAVGAGARWGVISRTPVP